MSLITETSRVSDVLLYEVGEAVNLVRDNITVASGNAASVVGQVLGQITLAGATETHAGNTGNGVMTIDVTTPVLANAQSGVYSVKCITATTNSGTFRVFDPKGDALGDVVVAATFADQIKFVIADGSADFIVGDTFLVTVAVGSQKFVQVAPAALDGSQYAAAILITPLAALVADAPAAAITRGPAILKDAGIAYTAGMTTPQKATAKAQLLALGIRVRAAYGV